MGEMEEPGRSTSEMLDVVHRRAASIRRGRRRRRVGGGLAAVAVVAAATVVVVSNGDDGIEIGTTPHDPDTSVTSTPATPPSAPTIPATTATPTTAAAATTTHDVPGVVGLMVRPHGADSDRLEVTTVQFGDRSTPTTGEVGQVVLEHEFGLVIVPDELASEPDDRSGSVRSDARTGDGQLAVELHCESPECSFEPRNDAVQIVLTATLSTTEIPLEPGRHDVSMVIEFDDGATIPFELVLWAEAPPSHAYSDQVRASTGAPAEVQRILGVGRFAYHVTVAFESVWVLGRSSSTVTRLDAVTGERLAIYPVPASAGVSRVTSTDHAIYVNGSPLTRIDPVTGAVSHIDMGDFAFSVIGRADTVWTAGRGGAQRIDADGTVTDLEVPGAIWIDLAVADGLVWAVSQDVDNRLIAFDGDTGEVVHDLSIVEGFTDRALPVRLVADDTAVVVGVDTSGGGGRTGALVFVDPSTGVVTDQIDLDHRPEGIALTPGHVWTSGAVLDRATLEITDVFVGFSLAVDADGDGSVWGIGGIPGSADSESMVRRLAPGDHRP